MPSMNFSPYDAKQAEINRMAQYADALRQQGMESPQGQMAGRTYVPPSWTQGLAQMLKAYGGGKGVRMAEEQSQALAGERSEKMLNALRGYGAGGKAEALLESPDTAAFGVQAMGQEREAAIDAAARTDDRKWRAETRAEEQAFRAEQARLLREFTADQKSADRETRIQAAGMGGAGAPPSNVQEWEYFSKLPPDQQQQYMVMKRANPYLNLGGEQVQMNPVVPGQRVDVQPVTPKPENTPQFKADVATAVAQAESTAKAQNSARGIGDVITEAEGILSGKSGNLPTASGFGAAMDKGAAMFGMSPDGAAEADQLRAIGGALVSKMPRMEGPQSNIDVQNYREMAGQVGDPTIPIERRKAALEVVKKLYTKYADQQPAAPAQPAPASGGLTPEEEAELAQLRQELNGGR